MIMSVFTDISGTSTTLGGYRTYVVKVDTN